MNSNNEEVITGERSAASTEDDHTVTDQVVTKQNILLLPLLVPVSVPYTCEKRA